MENPYLSADHIDEIKKYTYIPPTWQDALQHSTSDLIVALAIQHIKFTGTDIARLLSLGYSAYAYNHEIASLTIKTHRGAGQTTALRKLVDILWVDRFSVLYIVQSYKGAKRLRREIGVKAWIKRFDAALLCSQPINNRTVILIDNASLYHKERIDFIMRLGYPRAIIMVG